MSGGSKDRSTQANEGIQATTVSAEVLAVGRNAKASKTIYAGADQEKLAKAVAQLGSALEALQLQPQAKAALDEDLKNLHAAVQAKEVKTDHVSQILQGVASKLKAVGVVLTEVLALSGPVSQIAQLLQIPLHLIGL